MTILEIIDLKTLQQVQDQFADATGLAAIIVDSNGEYVTKSSNFTDFCMRYTRGSAEGKRRCVKCDTQCTGSYVCHAGLMDFSADIIVNNQKIGAIIGGQVLSAPPDDQKFREIARELGIDPDTYIAALHRVPIRSEKSIRASSGLLAFLMNELLNAWFTRKHNAHRISTFDREVASVLGAVNSVKSKMRDLNNVASMENILAINASIEAARAGQAGVGFAVVAREIGQLSQSSTVVFSEITDLVSTIEKSVNTMVSVEF